ncbi:hypothetical protein [Pleionea sediminis]|uniref:hypothetical protein n=1 Tax=Pleionea sediminis TaxID=2569479 RepID=UPI0011860583|nr:hypothetical protein [Pleionea sediminis]
MMYKTKCAKWVGGALACLMSFSSQATTVIAGDNDYIPLGTAYNSVTGEFLNYKTVQGQSSEVVGAEGTDFFFETNQNYQQIASVINGSVTADLNFPVASVDAGAEVALESSADEFSSNWVFMARHHAKSKILLRNPGDSDVVLSPQGQAVLNTENLSDSQLLERAGDEFVREIERSALLFVSMKAEYVSASDKLAFEGALDVDFSLGEVSGELDYLDDKQKASINITVRAHQFGGDPLALLKAIPDNFVQCSALNFETCRTLFENVIKYARSLEGSEFEDDGFSKMILTPSNSNVVGYKTQRYFGTASNVHQLGRRSYDVNDNSGIIRDLQRDYAEEMQNKSRATSLLSRSSSYLNSYQRQSLRFITEAAQKNADTLKDLADYCEKNIYNNDCSNYLEENCDNAGNGRACLTTYSQKVLDLGGSDELELALNTYSYPIKMQSGRDASYMLIGAENSGTDYWNHDSATGKVTTNGWGFQFSGFFNETRKGRFLTKSSKKLAMANPVGIRSPINGSYKLWVYTENGWEIARDKKYGEEELYKTEVVLRAKRVDGHFHYITEWETEKNDEPEAAVSMAFWRTQFGKSASDLYFFLDRTITVPMLNEELELFNEDYQMYTHSDTTPWFYTAQNLNVAKDINGNDIGWCVDSEGNLTRNTTAMCRAKGRLYNQVESEKACEAYSEKYEAITGMFWSLPTTPDGINMNIRLRAEMNNEADGSAIYARSHLLGGKNAWSMNILPYGYITSSDGNNPNQFIDNNSAYFWMASPQLNRLDFTSKPYILTGMWGHIEQSYPVRCVGKFSR